MTTLSSQLQALSAAVGIDRTKRPKGQVSLLHDPRTAADIDVQTVFDTAVKGFENLCRADARFVPFKKSLFSQSSLSYDRDLQTKETNAKVEASIKGLLYLITPHFLTAAATAVLEYLVRKYKVHVHGASHLLACLLPFHATAEFVRVVQICKLDGTVWKFLGKMQETGATLPRAGLVRVCARQRAVLRAVCDIARESSAARSMSRTLASFYAVLLCEAVALGPVDEALLQLLLPNVVAGLKASAAPDFRAATLMVLTQLASSTALERDFLDALLEDLCKRASAGELPELLMLLAHLFATQPQLDRFPEKAFKHVVKLGELPGELAALAEGGMRVDALVAALAAALAESVAVHTNYGAMLGGLLAEVDAPAAAERAAETVLRGVMEGLAEDADGDEAMEDGAAPALAAVMPVLRALETRYPAQMDAAVQSALTNAQLDKARPQLRARFLHVVGAAMTGSVHAPLGDKSNLTLALAVDAPSAAVRRTALAALGRLAAADGADADAVAFAHACLLRRLGDDDDSVVLAALQQPALAAAPRAAVAEALAAALAAANGRLHGGEAREAAAWTRAGARGIARRVVKLLAQMLGGGADEVDRVLALLLPHCIFAPSCRKLAAVTVRALARSPCTHPLIAAFAGVAVVDAKHAAAAKPKRAAKGAKAKKTKRALAADQARLDSDAQNNAAVREALASVLARQGGDRAALLRVYNRTLLRGKLVTLHALRLAFGLPALEQPQPLVKASLESLIRWGAAAPHPADVLEALEGGDAGGEAPPPASQQAEHALLLREVALLALRHASGEALDAPRVRVLLPQLLDLPAPAAFDPLVEALLDHASRECSLPAAELLGECAAAPDQPHNAAARARALTLLAAGLRGGRLAFGDFQRAAPYLFAALASTHASVRAAAADAAAAAAESTAKAGPGAAAVRALLAGVAASREALEADAGALQGVMHGLFAASDRAADGAADGPAPLSTPHTAAAMTYLLSWISDVDCTPGRIHATDVLASTLLKHADPVAAARAAAALLARLKGAAAHVTQLDEPSRAFELAEKALSALTWHTVTQLAAEGEDAVAGVLAALEPPADELATGAVAASGRPAVALDLIAFIRLRVLTLFGLTHTPAALPPLVNKRALKAVLHSAAADPSQACRTAAHAALEGWAVTATDVLEALQPLLTAAAPQPGAAGSDVQKSARKKPRTATRGRAGEQAAPLDANAAAEGGGAAERVDAGAVLHSALPALELLQWKHVEGGVQLLGALETALRFTLQHAGSLVQSYAPEEAGDEVDVPTSAGGDAEPTSLASSAGYAMTLVLAAFRRLVQDHSAEDLASVDMALFLTAAQSAPDTAIASSALLLLADLAHKLPAAALTHVLSVVRLGAAAAAADDDSLRVVSRALAAVAAAWLASGEAPDALWGALVDALPDAPPHRRLPLVTALLDALPPAEGLRPLTALVLGRVAEAARGGGGSAPGAPVDPAAAPDPSEWLPELLSQAYKHVPAALRMDTLAAVIEEAIAGKGKPHAPLPRLVLHFATAQVKLAGSFAALEDGVQAALQRLVAAALSHSRLLSQVRETAKNAAALKAASSGVQALLSALQKATHTAAFLTSLVAAVRGDDDGVQRTALRLLCKSLEAVPQQLRDLEALEAGERAQRRAALQGAACDMVAPATALLDAPAATAPTQQAALMALDAVAAALPDAAAAALVPCVPTLLRAAEAPSSSVRGSALACLGRVAACAGNQLVPHLPLVAAAVLQRADASLDALSSQPAAADTALRDDDAIELTAALAAVSSLLTSLPGLMSPYLDGVLKLLLHPRVLSLDVAACRAAAERMRAALPSQVAPRLLLPALLARVDGDQSGVDTAAFTTLMRLVADMAASMAPAAAVEHSEALSRLLVRALDVRSRAPDGVDVDVAEAAAVDALLAFVMKLGETTFKGLFLRMTQWGASVPSHVGASETPEARAAALTARQTTFLSCVAALATQLRSVFTPYFAYVWDALIELLRSPDPAAAAQPKKKRKSASAAAPAAGAPTLLQLKAVRCLHSCFLFDTAGFLTPQRFDRVLAPLVEQLSAGPPAADVAAAAADAALDGKLLLGARSQLDVYAAAVGGALVQLAVTVNDDSLWKRLNHRVLLMTRHDDAACRRAAVEVVYNVVDRLREEYLVLLPETLPFLSELLEDGDTAARARTQEVIKLLESLSGEELDEYLKP